MIYNKLKAIQAKKLKVSKDGNNTYHKSKYATLENVWEVLQPEVEEQNLLVLHYSDMSGVTTQVIDLDSEDDFIVTSVLPFPEDKNPQKLGSAITYAKRYNLGQIFNLMTDEDDDGNTYQEKSKTTSDLDL